MEVGGEVGVGLADLVEEPGVESDGVLGIESGVLEGLELEGETEEFSAIAPGLGFGDFAAGGFGARHGCGGDGKTECIYCIPRWG